MSESDDQELFDLRLTQAMADVYQSFRADKEATTFWLRLMLTMVVCQLSAIVYDMTLPAFQSLSMPFLLCFVLTYIGSRFPMRRLQKHLDKMADIARERKEEHYRLVTGEKRR